MSGHRLALAALATTVVALTFGLDLVALLLVFRPPVSPLELVGLAAGIALWGHVAVLAVFGALAGGAAFARVGRIALGLMVGLLFASRAVQLAALYYHGARLPAEALTHLELLPLFFTGNLLAVLGIGALAVAACLVVCLRALGRAATGQGADDRWPLARSGAWAACYPMMLLCVLAAAVPHERRLDVTARFGIPTGSPELALARSVARGLGAPPATARPLSAGDRRALARFGIRYASATERYPLVKDRAFSRPLPFARRGMDRARPNVVLLFVEGLSAELVGAYNPALARVTPSLDRFAGRAMAVDGHHAHAATTVGGLRGQLCSYYPISDHRQWQRQRLHRATTLLCLPRVLRRVGYETIYLSHGNPEVTNLAAQAVAFGFERTLFRHEVAQRLLGEATAPRGDLGDAQMFRALGNWLERRAARGDRRPFFVALSTLDTHPPYAAGSNDPGRAPLAATLAATDRAFGGFWKRLQALPLATRTLVVVTADHAQWPSAGYRRLVGRRAGAQRYFGYGPIALLIHDPTHELPSRYGSLSSSVDLAPTLLHLLGVDVRNPFQGRSLFDGGPRRGVFGATRSSGYVLDRAAGLGRGFALPLDLGSSEARGALALFVRWHAYQQSLIVGNRIWHRALER